MRFQAFVCIPILACVVSSCRPRPSAPPVVLELAFDDAIEAAAWIEVECATAPAGVTHVPGVDGQAAHFDGSGACVDVDGVDALPVARGFTLEAWVRPENWKNPYAESAALETVVSHSDDFWIAIVPGAWTFDAGVRTREERVVLQGGAVRLDAWQHVALVLEDEANMLRLYVDGRVVAQRELRGRVDLQPGIPVRVGTWFRQNQAFRGAVDTLRIWERSFTMSEMLTRVGDARPPRTE